MEKSFLDELAEDLKENTRKQKQAEQDKKLSKETISKLIQKEAEIIRENNPKLKESYEETKKYKEEGSPSLNPIKEKVKLNPEDVGEYIKTWAEDGFTPITIASMKEVAKISDFNATELKGFVNTEIKAREKKQSSVMPTIEEEDENEEENNDEAYEIEEKRNIKFEYLDFIRDKKWNEATELLVRYILSIHKIFTTKDDLKSEVWIYNEGIYIPQGKSQIKEDLRKILGKFYSSWIFGKVIDKIEPDTFINSNEFFNINYVNEIPVKNGILNVLTKELMPFDKNKIFFNKLPVTYDPNATCPTIDKHLKDVLKFEEDIQVIYEIIGFLLYKEYFLEKMIMFVGDGRNGKGKTIDLIRRFIGIENCASVTLSALSEDNFKVCELFGKMTNLAGDLSNTSLKDTGMLKQTTGRDLIGANRKFLTDIKFVNYAKHIFACNELPKVYDMSKGFWSRWLVLEFPYEFINEDEYNKLESSKRENKKILDPYHIDKISSQAELDGLLNKALEGLAIIRKNKTFSYSRGTEEIKKFWIRKSDSFIAFCFDHLEESSTNEISKADLRKAYYKYCSEHKLKGCSDKSMMIALQEMFGVTDSRRTINNNFIYIWEGIKFKDQSKYNQNFGKL